MPIVDTDENLPTRCWSQKAKDAQKAERRKLFEEYRQQKILLVCFMLHIFQGFQVAEGHLICVSVDGSSAVTRDLTISSNAPVYFCWSPLIHRIIYHLKCVIQKYVSVFLDPSISSFRSFAIHEPVEQVRIPPKILQLKVLTNHSIEMDLHLPRDHRYCLKLSVLFIIFLNFDKCFFSEWYGRSLH